MIYFLKSIKNQIDILTKISIIKTIYYNYFSRHVIRNNGKLIIYKNTKLYFKLRSKIVIENGTFFLGGGKPRGAHNCSMLRLLENSVIYAIADNNIEYEADIYCAPNSVLRLNGCYTNCRLLLRVTKEVSIGKGTVIGAMVDIRNGGHGLNGVRKHIEQGISIGDHVWVADRVTLISGARIESGSVIGACSLVTKTIPSNTLAYGIPATIKKQDIEWEI